MNVTVGINQCHLIDPPRAFKHGGVLPEAAGYKEEEAHTVCRALFCEQGEEDLKAAFALYDKDSNGHIDKEEFRKALPLMGEDIKEEKIDEVMEGVDAKKTGKLEFPEFCTLVRRMNPKEAPDAPAEEGEDPLKDAWGK
ncbi:unnamed protein product, partial [Prorocentrum cordatum]